MDASKIEIEQGVPASRKLGQAEAEALVAQASKVIVAKGKKVSTFRPASDPLDEIVEPMLGSTGNLRSPTIRVGKTVVVGFNDEVYAQVLLG
jgi:hypothetical protein